MILGKKDKDYVAYLKKGRDLDIKRIEHQDKTITKLNAAVTLLTSFDDIHEATKISYTDLAKHMGISLSTLNKYRNSTLPITPVRYRELLIKLINSLLEHS